MIIVFTGNGKGKTTAGLGQMTRAAGRGRNALMIQFIKGPWKSGEDGFAEQLKTENLKSNTPAEKLGEFEIKKMGLGFVGILGDKLPFGEHQKAAEEALDFFKKETASGKWYLIVLDEVNVAISLGLLMVEDVLEAVKDYPKDKLLILSGRSAPAEIMERADLITEMKEIKHPYNRGEDAVKGVEF